MSELLHADDFRPHVGKTFRFKGTSYAMPLDHIVCDDRPLPKGVKRLPFLLIFRAPREQQHMLEGLYQCEVEDGATYALYVAPVQTLEIEFQDYQAAFN